MAKKKKNDETRTGEGQQTEVQAKGKGKAKAPAKKQNVVWEYTKSIGIALVIALLLRQFLVQAFRIPTGSMLDTLQIGDYLFVNKFLYGAKTPDRIRILNWTVVEGLPVLKLPAIREPRQGDIIVFEYPRDRNLDYIKRCVAVEGDTVSVKEGVLYVNSEVYESNFGDLDGDHSCIPSWTNPDGCPEPHSRHDRASYVSNSRNHNWPWPGMPDPYVVPEGHIFMMGDNRYNSMDSRYWGPLDKNLLRGKAIFLYWSWDGDRHLPRLSRIGDLIR